ncbi:hypothetical protein Ami103574_04380 [Aminipila butyrica]|uniref:Elp3/MiaA/NifB-like radical SAM core domain-containing protein n=2 Tax=Aminipila butyrica TaxID=433296 RepID=A0A858BZ22_9FIRM|nr:hypothetical protein Ami103574_04380 [Aminipila butyrica]
MAFIGPLPREIEKSNPGIKEVHISVTFTYDIPKAEKLYKSWSRLGVPIEMGGPAFGDRNGDFVPGQYLKPGYTFTSRGCNNKCWFCSAWRDTNGLRELEIKDGWNILDDNILGTSDHHFMTVMDMLHRQPERPIFTGGIEAKLLRPWQAKLMKEIKTRRLYCAYDTPDDYEPLVEAGKIFRAAGFTTASHVLSCYVLIGYRGDTFEKAKSRLIDTIRAGFVPYAMLYRDKGGQVDPEWRAFQREWCRPQIVGVKMREYGGGD